MAFSYRKSRKDDRRKEKTEGESSEESNVCCIIHDWFIALVIGGTASFLLVDEAAEIAALHSDDGSTRPIQTFR